ncbi:hypothetical protein [Bacillus alkalicellulosilyticus]|uniref:hypothetical protein n=1 Tax=Alkalihalobacterium alkalicellulosilyticum TaxID=1912214 RepID=UPI000998B3E7|nr:hypothetical protein [Bacillus alkalicellulosilyticus]
MFRKIIPILIFFGFLFAIVGCQQEVPLNPEQQQLKERMLEMLELHGDRDIQPMDIEDAVEEANKLGLLEKEKYWFVRTYLIHRTVTEDSIDSNTILEESILRMKYHEVWMDVAQDKYNVPFERRVVQELTEEDIGQIKHSPPEIIVN